MSQVTEHAMHVYKIWTPSLTSSLLAFLAWPFSFVISVINSNLTYLQEPPLYGKFNCTSQSSLKGTMSPQVYVQVDEKHFEIVGPTFSNTIRELRRPLYRMAWM